MDDAARRAVQESAELTRTLMAAPEQMDALYEILGTVSGQGIADAGSLTLCAGDRPFTVASTDDDVTVADELQYELGEGPCLDAISDDTYYVVPDVATDRRWPRWGPQAAQLGVGSIVSVRLFTCADVSGSLNLYSLGPRSFDEHDLTTAYVIAAHVAIVLVAIHRDSALIDALEARALIAEAQGTMMERYGVDADRAFVLLSQLSQDNGLPLRKLAAELLRTSDRTRVAVDAD